MSFDFDDLLEEEYSKEELEVLNCEPKNTFIRGWDKSTTTDLIFKKIKHILEGSFYPEEILMVTKDEGERKYLREKLLSICGEDGEAERIDIWTLLEFLDTYAPKTQENMRTFRQINLFRDRKIVFIIDPPESFRLSKNFLRLLSKLFPSYGARLLFWEYEDFIDPINIRYDLPESNIITLESSEIRRVRIYSPDLADRVSEEKNTSEAAPIFPIVGKENYKRPKNISPELYRIKSSEFMGRGKEDDFVGRKNIVSPELFAVKSSQFKDKQSPNNTYGPRRKPVSPELFNVMRSQFLHSKPRQPDEEILESKVDNWIPKSSEENKRISPLITKKQPPKEREVHRVRGYEYSPEKVRRHERNKNLKILFIILPIFLLIIILLIVCL